MPFEFGTGIKCRIFGASHAPEIGVTITGLPQGFRPDPDKIADFMKRRMPSDGTFGTKRHEDDIPEVTFGENYIKAIIKNKDVRPQDYQTSLLRPGHADYTQLLKYGKIESGGGIFSGRMTAPLCFAGEVCKQFLEEYNVRIYARIVRLYGIEDTAEATEDDLINTQTKLLPVVSETAAKQMTQVLKAASDEGDSLGAIVECTVFGLPAGIGDAMNCGLESILSKDIFGIPAVKGIEFGSGFASGDMKGSENNDAFRVCDGNIETVTNNCGGILGGISTGMPIVFRCAVKPTPSISKEQNTVDISTMTNTVISVSGRHDVCCAIRAVPVIEAVTAIALAGLVCRRDIPSLRGEIDSIDDKIAELLVCRKSAVDSIGRIKSGSSLPVRDEKRENAIIERLSSGLDEADKEYVSEIMRSVFKASRKAEGEKQ